MSHQGSSEHGSLIATPQGRAYGTLTPLSRDRHERPQRPGAKSRWILCCTCSFVAILIYVFAAYCLWIFACLGGLGPPFQKKTWNDFTNQSFAVGFDLTAGYGTASVAFFNGTILNVARVEGTPEYNQVLARLSLKSSAHPTRPYHDCNTPAIDLPRQWYRYLRKKRGLAASNDVAALASVLGPLKVETDKFFHPSGRVQVAFITVPNLPALYLEDLVDAAEYVNVQLLTLPQITFRGGDEAEWPVSEINTAMAGNGLGLSQQDVTQGVNDEQGSKISDETPWSSALLSVLFTSSALAIFTGPFPSATGFTFAKGIVNFDLGLGRSPSNFQHNYSLGVDPTCPAPSSYWTQVRNAVRFALDSGQSRGTMLGRVVSYGECAQNERFDSILKEEVLDRHNDNDPGHEVHFFSDDPVFAAARGAATFAVWCAKVSYGNDCFPDLRFQMPGW